MTRRNHREAPTEPEPPHTLRGWLAGAIQFSLDLLYPPRCAGCGRVDRRWCEACRDALQRVALDLRTSRLPPLSGLATTGIHEGKLQESVHALKYAGVHELAAPLSERMLTALFMLEWQIDVIVAVPLHERRERERGVNQSVLLANGIAGVIGLPCTHAVLRRTRDTPPQVGLNRAERQANMHDAFHAQGMISGNVLLVDDVFTTGATLQACARALREAGASAVYGLTASAARPPHNKGAV